MFTKQRIINLFYHITLKRNFFKKKTYDKFINNIKHYPNIKKYLDDVFCDSDNYRETLYRLLNNINIRPICPICGDKINLTIKSHIFFPETCSSKCAHLLSAQKSREKCLSLYNIDNFAKLESSKQKYKDTCLNKYGVDAAFKSEEIKDKIKKTFIEKYNVTSNLLIKEIHDKGVQKSQSKEVIEKRNNTIFEKYGVSNVSQSQLIKEKKEKTFLSHYGVKNNFQRQEIKEKNNSLAARQKMYETKRKNHTFNSSITEEETYSILKEKYPSVVHHYKSVNYPFECDFYIPELDLYIECNYHWTHGNKPYEGTYEDNLILEKWKAKQSKYYINAIYTWTDLDVRKRKFAVENNLNYLLFYNINDFKTWINNVNS